MTQEYRQRAVCRLLEKTRRTSGCWYWEGAKQVRGYGRMFFLGRAEGAHRVSYVFL